MSTRILLALTSPGMLRVVEHLLEELPDMRIVDRSATAAALPADAARWAPDVIVASTRFLGRELDRQAAQVRGSSPRSKLLLITSDGEWRLTSAHRSAADASLDEEDLVLGLLPLVHTLAARPTQTRD
jgi:DNA-binding NarL/FixJ family response regulator